MAAYTTGTVQVTAGSGKVFGTLTEWNVYVDIGDLFKLTNENVFYDIAAVNSATELTLSTRYSNTNLRSAVATNLSSVNTATITYSGNVGSFTPVIQNRFVLEASPNGGGERFTDNGAGVLTGEGSPAGFGTVDYDSGAWTINFGTTLTATLNLAASFVRGQTLAGSQYQTVIDFTPNYKIPEMSTNDINFSHIYTKAMRVIDQKIKAATNVTGVKSITASYLEIYNIATLNNVNMINASITNATLFNVGFKSNIMRLPVVSLINTQASILNGSITNLKSRETKIFNASIQKLKAVNASIINASIQTLKVVNPITKIEIVNASITNASINTLNANTLTFVSLDVVNATLTNASIQKARIVNASITNASIQVLRAIGIKVGTGSGYVNLNATVGINGYGIRDNSGITEHKHSGKMWAKTDGYIDGPDNANNHYSDPTMTFDGTWRVLNVGTVCSSEAHGIKLVISQNNANVGKTLQFRKHGNTNVKNVLIHKQQVAGVTDYWGGDVEISATGAFDYFGTGTDGTWNSVTINIRGSYA